MNLTREEMVAMGLRDKIDTLQSKLDHAEKDSDFYCTLALNYLEKILRQVEIIADDVAGRDDAS